MNKFLVVTACVVGLCGPAGAASIVHTPSNTTGTVYSHGTTDDLPYQVNKLRSEVKALQGQVNALAELGVVRRRTGDYPGAAEALAESLSISRDLGYRIGQANALNYLGPLRRLTGDHQGAAEAVAEALGIFRDLGHRWGEAEALNEAGTLHRIRGDLDTAAACHHQALDRAREINSRWEQAHAHAGLGRCALATGNTATARARLHRARAIFRQIGAPETSGITAELDALTQAEVP